MKTTLTRLFTVMMLIIVSMGAMADVKVLFGEKGTELQPAKDGTITLAQKELTGGTIIISQEDQKDGTTEVTFAVTPDKNYKLAENGLEVYAAIPADISPTRGVEVSTTLTLKSEDFKDEASKRTYTTTIDSKLALWVKSADFQQGRGDGAKTTTPPPPPAGIWYIANSSSGNAPTTEYSYDASSPENNYYLVPAADPHRNDKRDAYYSADNYASTGDPARPFITTYKTAMDNNSIWFISPSGDGYYFIIHAATGKYLIYEPPHSAATNRKSMHLQTVDNDTYNPSTNNDFKFEINTSGIGYTIRPYRVSSGNKLFNVANRNFNYYYGPSGATYYHEGLVGLYSSGHIWVQKDASNADFVKPVISNVDESTNTFTISFPTVSITHPYTTPLTEDITALGITSIIYTTNGDEPTVGGETTHTFSSAVYLEESCTVKARGVYGNNSMTPVVSKDLTPVITSPIITFDNTTGYVTLTTLTVGADIYYTLDGTTPNSSSNLYGEPFSVSETTTIKAITIKSGESSSVSELVVSQVATPTIQNNGSNAISITTTTPDATIYYTTDGSTPTTSSTEYTKPLTDNVSNVTIKAIAVKENMITSAVGSGSVKLQCAAPIITRDGMTFTLSCDKPTNASLYYTMGGGSETLYSGPVAFTSDKLPMTVTAVARHSDYTDSEEASMEMINGSGTPEDPYLIYGSTDFTNFVTNVNNGNTASKCYKLETDVSGSGVDAITTAFKGTFDGGMHIISDLGHALFNTVTDGVVKNVILDNVGISGGTNVGAICNEATGNTRIYNCGILATNSSVEKDDDGYDVITSCSSSVSGSNYVGGIVGLLDGTSRVINCFSYADVSGGSYVGGIVGYNNVASTNPATDLKTMVMNCMFYGEVSGSSIAPIYNGEIITNIDKNKGVGNYNYFRLEASYVQPTGVTYNCALGAEDRYLQRFEFFRNLLNSHRELAGWWATGTYSSSEMMKWVLEPSQIGTAIPYPILKKPGRYHSVVNIDNLDVVTQRSNTIGTTTGTLTVNIQMGDGAVYQRPSNAAITTSQLMLNITDKDPDHFNFNYHKVQLPYYNDVGTKNYNGNRVVTGWKIVSISGGTPGSFTTGDDAPAYNFADRNCTNKDLYGANGSNRIFNQGAYWDVPEGVTAITIEPYWAKCVYLADPNADKVYNTEMKTGYDVPNVGGGTIYTNGNSYSIAGENQVVYTTMSNAIASTALYADYTDDERKNHSVYDYAVVLVGNYHQYYAQNTIEASKSKPYTVTSIDLDGDNEPDYSYILRFDNRAETHPVRADFINIPGLGMAQKSTGGTGSYNFGIMIPKGWFEGTNTSLFRFTQFEYEHSSRSATDAIIMQGGVIEQWVSYNQKGRSNKIPYIHVGSNVWFKEFHTGCHQDKNITTGFQPTKHSPISVTGGDFDKFYLTGLYVANVGLDNYADNAECYINGGRFGTVCGAAMEGIGKANGSDNTGNITWQIQNADIKEFYAGGLNAAKPVTGNLSTTIVDSHVDIFCGGPKFGDMSEGKTVTTNATGCTFGTFFGAGYGGNSYSRQAPRNHNNIVNFPHNDSEGAGNNSDWNDWLDDHYTQAYSDTYGGVSTQFSYQFLPMSNNGNNVARIFVDYVAFSLATTHDVTSSLTGCTITGNFYGGGSLGKVEGDVTSTLTNCTVNGSVFGAGYSASLPTVEVMDVGFKIEPWYYTELGTYRMGVFPTPTTTYHWEHATATEFSNKQVDNNNHILYTTADLTALGTVTGTATLTIDGSTTVVGESVYGGGEESSVNLNTVVVVNDGTIGVIPAGQTGGATHGNVYGGGKGKYKENKIVNGVEAEVELEASKAVTLGLVKGNTNVTINGGSILHNVYGGGAYGSVGEFDYDATTGMPTARKANTTGGTANVTILGGTIGTNGDENGMVFGSSRGDVGAPGEIHDKLAWVYDTHVVIGTTGQGTDAPQPQIKGSVYGSGENGHTYQNTIVDVHSGTIGIASGSTITTNDNGTPEDTSDDTTYSGAAYPYRGNVYGGGCGTDKYASVVNGTKDTYNPLAGIVQGTTQVNIDGGLVVRNVYGAGAMGSVGTTTTDATTGATTFASGTGTTTIAISGGTVGVDGNGNGNVFGAARGDAATTQTDVALVKSTGVTISNGTVKGNVYGGGETGDVGTYTTNTDDVNIYPEGSGICNVTVTGGTIGVEGNRHGNVFGAGKGDASTFKCMKAMAHSTNVNISKGTVWGNVYGGGEIGRVENNTVVTIGAASGTDELNIKGDVFGAGKGLDTHGYSALVRGNPVVTVQGSAKVGGSVYGGGEIASVGKHSLVTPANASEHPELEEGMPFTLANTNVGICTVTVKDKAEITRNVFGAGKGVKPAEITNPGRMKPDGSMEYYNNNGATDSYGEGFENAFHIYVQTLALVTETHVTIGGSDPGTETKVNGSVYGGSESGFVQYHTYVDIQDNCVIGTSSVDGNVYGGGLGISGNDVAGRVGGNTKLDINGGTTHGSVFGGGAYGVVKGGVDVNINDGIIDKDVYGGGALAHTNTAMWDDANSQLLPYAEVTNLIVGSSPVTGYYNENKELITTENATAEDGKKYYAVYKTNVNLLGGQLRDAYGGGLGQLAKGSDPAIEAFVYGDVKVELNHNTTTTDADGLKKGCIVERLFGCNNLNGTPKGKAQVYVYATQNKNKPEGSENQIISAKFSKHEDFETGEGSTYDVKAVYGGGNLSPYYPEDADSDDENVLKAARSEVYIYGCDLTSIKQVYGGGNAAPTPATLVQVNSVYEIEEVFGGGNGHDAYVLDGKTYLNPGANVGYKNYTHSVLNSATGYYEAVENQAPDYLDATTKENRRANYLYGAGIARLEVFGGKIHAAYGGSNEKGNISNIVSSMYDKDGNCTFEVLETYGGGKNSVIDGTIDLDVGCAEDMPQIFGGSKAADVNSDITLRITNGTYGQVFGGNNTSGNVNGSITVIIQESGCKPINIGELYAGGYFAGYSIYGYKEVNGVQVPRTKEDWEDLSDDEKEAEGLTVPRKDPRINVISATQIDEIYGGGYKALVVGNPHVNINMEKGMVIKKYAELMEGYDTAEKDAVGNMILPIGTIGNVYGGGNEADIGGNTYVEIGTGMWLNADDVWETKDADGHTYTYNASTEKWRSGDVDAETAPTPVRYSSKISGDVYGGGNKAAVRGNTYVNVCAVNNDDPATTDDIEMISVKLPTTIGNDVTIGGSIYGGGSKGDVGVYTMSGKDYVFNTGGKSYVTINGGTIGTVSKKGNVFGGGMGEALESGTGAFMCEKAMVDYTNVVISNGTVNGTVYGGGEVGRVNNDTKVTIGLKRANLTEPAVSTPTVEGSVYGAGKGLSTHGYAALVRGNSYVTVQGDAKVKDCVYGGGEIASVGKYSLDAAGMPQSLANRNSGYCTVIVRDNAEIGPDDAMRMITESGYPDDAGHVFGAGKGILPYEGYDLTNDDDIPWRVKGNDQQQWFGPGEVYVPDNNQDSDYKKAYLRYIETLGLATQTYVTIDGNALVKGSVYGGSMNGHVQHNTQVTIAGGQIGCQKGKTGRLDASVWEMAPSSVTEDYECASWNFTGDHHPYDIYDYVDPTAQKPVPKPATDGHTFFGNVFGGGSGYYPYRQDPDYETKDSESNKSRKDLGYAGGLWHREAGSVGGSTVVNITGGHILTSVYGGNEQTDVGTYVKDSNYENTTSVVSGGKCTINMSGGTVGVPRTPQQMKDHPVTCYVFGAGKGDQRINFNKWTNVASTQVNISGNARIYGSTFGGGEDGHVVGNVETNIDGSDVIIGTTGTSGVDGNIFGGGRGFSETALTAGVVGGDVAVNIHNGSILGTVYGGGRLASVGTHFADAESADYGTMQNTITPATYYTDAEIAAAVEGDDAYGKSTSDIKTPESKHGQITITIDGGTIGATDSNGKLATSDFSIGDVFGGCKGSSTDSRFGLAKNTIVIISGTDTKVNGNVFGGGEAGYVEQDVTVNIKGGTVGKDVYGGGALANTNTANWDDSQYVEVTGLPKGHTLTDLYTKSGETYTLTESGAEAAENTTYYSKGTWATGKYNETTHATTYKTKVTLTGGIIEGNVYGGGLGQIAREASAAVGTEGEPGYIPAVTKLDEVKAKVYGDALVMLNGPEEVTQTTGEGDNATTTTTTTYGNCVVQGNIFGCNNQNGSPQSAVTVHVYKTEGWEGHMRTGTGLDDADAVSSALNDPTDSNHSYELKGVYGGGNLSAFYPDLKATRDTVQAYVIIDGCKQTSIKQVYGGGNAASTPATNITINATYEIEEVFGGGNGLDDITIHGVTQTNPGANVGYEGYPTSYDIPASSKEERTAKFSYGSGKASVTIYDGLIHRVFGGSNNKGNVRESAVTLLDDMSGCDFQIDEAYGGGKNAPMDAEAKLLMACIPGLKVAYGGAQEADVLGGVTLTITNGTYERVFGGNNVSGTIQGPIVVNVEETGCRPIIIGELYGGGNEAPYSVYGYDGRTPIEPGENVTRKWDDPQVNVKSFTSIGNVYGGGYGQTAVMVGNPTVNINVAEGKYSGQTSDNYFTGFTYDATNKRYSKVIGGNTVYVPAHKENTIGAIYNVFGGGNAAKVIGNPNVNIGTRMGAEEYMAVVDVPKNVVGLYTRTGEGTTESPYIYTEVKGTSVTPSTGTTYYKKYTIMGADIRGNVYGGGNNAEVTGDTNVTIGKKATP